MKTTISVIKADVGSIGGHIKPSAKLRSTIESFVREHGKKLLIDCYVSTTGDDVALLMSHERGVNDPKVHELAWDTFMAGTKVAKEQGLYGAGQDLLKDAFSGNVRGLGPASAEMEFEERTAEPFLFFAADKTDPGAYNLPLYLGFLDPMHNSGLLLSPKMAQGFTFTIMDVNYT
jgi:fructose 1,6-bisphosphate aldolase/phosphatase